MANFKNGPVGMVTNALNKKGTLKGKNKKETKQLKAICPHHKFNKKGKLKPTIFNNGDGTCTCEMCGARFPASFYKNNELDDVVGGMQTLNDQAKYMAVSLGAGNETIEYFSQAGGILGKYKKAYKKIRNVAEKQNSVKKKKNKKGGYGSSQYGSWGHR